MTADQFNMWLVGYLSTNVWNMRNPGQSFDPKQIGQDILDAARSVEPTPGNGLPLQRIETRG